MAEGSQTKTRLSAVLGVTSKEIQNKFEGIRVGLEHNGLVGDDGEQVVREFLRSLLPTSIGITTGEVVDSSGRTSRQADVILYAAHHTPMLFAGINSAKHSVPVEGVLAVIEVKTKLRAGDVKNCIENCRSIKRLSRTAYFPVDSLRQYEMYGQVWSDMPIFYSVFAPSSDGLYTLKFNELQESIPVEERVDMVCALDRGINVNASATRSGVGPEIEYVTSPRALVNGGMAAVEKPDKALLLWYSFVASQVMLAATRPIDISVYAGDDLRFDARMSAVNYDASSPELIRATAIQRGGDPDAAQSWAAGTGVTFQQLYELLRVPGTKLVAEGGGSGNLMAVALVEAARHLSFEEWTRAVGLDKESPG